MNAIALIKNAAQAAAQLLAHKLATLDDDDKDAILDLVEMWATRRITEKPENLKRYRAILLACRAVRGILGVSDDDADQLTPV